MVDRLTNLIHFLVVKTIDSVNELVGIYVQEIDKLHGILVFVISDRDMYFTSQFWTSFKEVLGTSLSFSITYHPQTDG